MVNNADVPVDDETMKRIRNRVLLAENEQLSRIQAYNIIPEIEEIIEEEIEPADVPRDTET